MPGGVKNWASGQTLDAADLNDYLANQVIARFATIAARTAAYGVAGAPALQSGLFAYVESTEKLYYYDGTSWDEVNAQVEDGEITEAKLADGAVTSNKIANDTIVDADIKSNAAIAKTKISGTAITAADTGTITGTMIANDAVALGTKTTGDYVANINAGTGVTISPAIASETASPTISIGQAVSTSSEVIFQGITQTSVVERITVSATAATGTIPVDVSNGTTYYTANSTANFVVNLRWNSSTTLNTKLAVGEMATTSFLVTNATAYYATSVQVNGTTSGVTTRWQGATGAPTLGNANSTDMYTFTVIKTAANTFTVFAAQTKFS